MLRLPTKGSSELVSSYSLRACLELIEKSLKRQSTVGYLFLLGGYLIHSLCMISKHESEHRVSRIPFEIRPCSKEIEVESSDSRWHLDF